MSREVDVRLPNDHWVSRGYQQNFATADKRIAIIDASAGQVIEPAKPIKSNFREPGFTTFVEAGVPNDLLERAFASVERSVLNRIRAIDGTTRPSPEDAGAIANLFAIHLVRSPAFKRFHAQIADGFRVGDEIAGLAATPGLREAFQRAQNRAPRAVDLEALILEQYDQMVADPMTLVSTMLRQHDLAAEKLAGLHVQVVTKSRGLPGFALGDTPIVHAHTASGRYGFRDRLALMDSSTIIGPISRDVAACFASAPVGPVKLRTHREVDALNAVIISAAEKEVACHPDDSHRLARVARRLDDLPPSVIFGS